MYWDGYNVIEISLRSHVAICGLCGDYDGNLSNDMMNQDNLQESNTLSFLESWQEQGCPPPIDLIDECVETLDEREVWAKRKCNIVNNEALFGICTVRM